MFQFIHAADIHLDSPLRGLERYEGAPVEQIRGASRRALENLVQLAIDQQVDFVLIAGDLYDGDWPDFNTGLFVTAQMSRLRLAEIPVFLIAGNHDAATKMTRRLPLTENVTMFSDETAESRVLADLDVVIHGQSFARPAVHENLALSYPGAQSGLFNIGLLHTCATSHEHERYAPCSVEDLCALQYDYWALGHVHQRQVLHETPWIGFSGNLQGRHIRETGPKGCLLVTVADDRSIATQFKPLDVLRWERAGVDVTEMQSVEEVLDALVSKLEFLGTQADGRTLAVRVELHGSTALHQTLQARKHHWMQQLRSLAIDAGQGEIWIEKIKLETTPLQSSAEPSTETAAAFSEVQRLFDHARNDAAALQQWDYDLDDVIKKLPRELKDLAPTDDTVWLAERLTQAEAYLRAGLFSDGESA